MSATKNSILSAIDELHNLDNQATMHVCESMVDVYCKACTILENCEEDSDISSFSIFKEGYYMEEDEITKTEDGGYKINGSDQTYYKDKGFRRMKDDGSGLESIIWSIIAAIPRMIKAAIESMFGKNAKSTEDIENEKKKAKAVTNAAKTSQPGLFGKFVDGMKAIGSSIGDALNNEETFDDPNKILQLIGATSAATTISVLAVTSIANKRRMDKAVRQKVENAYDIVSKSFFLSKIFHDVFDKNENINDGIISLDKNNPENVLTCININGIDTLFNELSTVINSIENDIDMFTGGNDEGKSKSDDEILNSILEKVSSIRGADKNPPKIIGEKTSMNVEDMLTKFSEIYTKEKRIENDLLSLQKKFEQIEKTDKASAEDLNIPKETQKQEKKINKELVKAVADSIKLLSAIGELSNMLQTYLDNLIENEQKIAEASTKNPNESPEEEAKGIVKAIEFLKGKGIQMGDDIKGHFKGVVDFAKNMAGKIPIVGKKFGNNSIDIVEDTGNGELESSKEETVATETPVEGDTEETPVENTEEIAEESFYFNFRG